MMTQLLERMTGEELLLLRILSNNDASLVEAELQRRENLGQFAEHLKLHRPSWAFSSRLKAAA